MSHPELAGIHHVKIPVTDLARSVDWYGKVFGYRTTWEFPEADGVVRGVGGEVPGLGCTLAFRVNPKAAEGCRDFDPVSFGVRDREHVEEWAAHLDGLGVPHSPVIEASLGWLLVFDDPDGLQLHLYSWAEHGIDQSHRPGYGRRVATAGTPQS
ncbi:MAG: VOC family protein [Pseudonocardiaceae bacterium]|nr:VOC family protein [Pseudonocardiaceae bacterium]